MPKNKRARQNTEDDEPSKKDDNECDHKHEQGSQNAAFMSLVYRIFRENQDLRTAYHRLLEQSTRALVRCLEERDPYTYGHSMRVMEYTMLIGREAKLKGSDLRNLELAAMFHDIGKIGVADCVLLKPDRLTPEEQKIIQQHPVKSGEIIGLIDEFKNIVPGVRHHHERIDGKGYPDKLSGNQIPLASRIILVADTFDAMTSTRPYRKAISIEIAYAELERYAGSQFDPDFVKFFLQAHRRLVEESEENSTKKAA